MADPVRGKSYHFDPLPTDRRYMRHRATGDLGWLVRRQGEDHVKYDRGGVDQTVVAKRDAKGEFTEWSDVAAPAPVNTFQIAMVAYEVNRMLDRYLGNVSPKKPWIDLDEDKRHAWLNDGPQMPGIRNEMYEAIMAVGEKYTG
jgi:hypothetical protein